MHDCNIIEVEDFGFNHYIHHLDDIEGDGFGYKNELDLIFDLTDCTYEMDCE
ncbi:hypothetical protein PGH07_01545 [Sulfurovum sp. zt1-1]|uniref:Uncharacterized protein n=1 Tax=Sulfurovum zhangzhouensis TaxID=3019067 RepID=A0ABT7QVI6_9BACT|nr:hypothetical protein [Sulfurovum zhangzhouensis]MDM5270857.1 hypothetical protein [Sulfurovum zhangzhouensis]